MEARREALCFLRVRTKEKLEGYCHEDSKETHLRCRLRRATLHEHGVSLRLEAAGEQSRVSVNLISSCPICLQRHVAGISCSCTAAAGSSCRRRGCCLAMSSFQVLAKQLVAHRHARRWHATPCLGVPLELLLGPKVILLVRLTAARSFAHGSKTADSRQPKVKHQKLKRLADTRAIESVTDTQKRLPLTDPTVPHT